MGRIIPAIAAISAMLLLGACAGQDGRPAAASPTETAASAGTGGSPSATDGTPTASAAARPTPSTVKRTVTRTRRIPYKTVRVRDSGLAKGTTRVKRRGVAGVMTLTYEVTAAGGKVTGRRLVRRTVTRKPVARIVAVGTKQQRRCDPNYSGCVPIADDVDCAGGSGNGPAYVSGPVRVTGSDIYDLDRDGDGIACDS